MSRSTDICKYSPDRGIDYYASGLAAILKVVIGPGRPSTHVYVKEIRRALTTLVHVIWDRSDEYIPVVAEANIPAEIQSRKLRECFKELLTGLLKRFRETAGDLPMGARIRLMNMTISGIAEMARRGISTPVGEDILKFVFFPASPSPSLKEVKGYEARGGT